MAPSWDELTLTVEDDGLSRLNPANTMSATIITAEMEPKIRIATRRHLFMIKL